MKSMPEVKQPKTHKKTDGYAMSVFDNKLVMFQIE